MTETPKLPELATNAGIPHAANGVPLSINRPAREKLRPWIAHVYGTAVGAPADPLIACGIFADAPVMRILFEGDWHVETRDGPKFYGPQRALLFGPHSKRMPVSLRGGFSTIGVALAPGALHAFGGGPTEPFLDRIFNYDALGWDEEKMLARFDTPASIEARMEILEDCCEILCEETGWVEPDPVSQGFNRIAFADPNTPVAEIAERLCVGQKTLERLVKRDFGMTPKRVLRRARALDMAAHLAGVADNTEAEELALRYYDQSHLNRDFMALLGMTPVQFVRTPRPLLAVTLEARQARRLEALDRLDAGARRPWQ